MNKFGIFLALIAALILVGVLIFILKPFGGLADKNDLRRISDLQKIARALEQYHGDYGRYPESDGSHHTIVVDGQVIPWGSSFLPYLAVLPKDPGLGRKYVYLSSSEDNFQAYRLYASLENGSNKQTCSGGAECPGVLGKELCGKAAPCNFAVVSSNTSP